MKNIAPIFDDNIGGLEMVLFTDWDNLDIAKLAQLQSGLQVLGDILKPGKVWYQLIHTRHSSEFEDQVKADRKGTLFNPKVSGFIPKDYPELAAQLFDMKQRRFALLFRDRNGYLKLAGSADHSFDFTYKFSSGNDPSRINGYQVSFKSECIWPAFYYSGPLNISEIGLVEPQAPGAAGGGAPVTIKRGDGTVVAVIEPGKTFIITSTFSWDFNII